MDAAGRRAAIEKSGARDRHVVEGIALGHEALVADEPVHALPRDLAAPGIAAEQLVKLLRAGAAGQADRDPPGIGRDPRHHPFGRGVGEGLGVGLDDQLRLAGRFHHENFRQLRPSRRSN
jgi:hypothetical protein